MSHADGGRRITALAAGGSVLLLSATAVALWPRTYGTAATLVLDGGSHVGNPIALAGRIEAALLEREGLATVAMDLPPELRSPDPIGRLRAGIRVQSRGALGFSVEFRGSDPQSVQRIANHLAERAVKLVPKLAAAPGDNAAALALAERSRAVTEFLTAHPEITLEQSPGKINPTGDSGLDTLRNEKRQIEQRLATGALDNPYAESGQSPEQLNLRLNEIKTTIARRELALKQPRPASPPVVPPELTSQWRALLAELATAQASASAAPPPPSVSAHVTATAPLPTVPLTPNRLVLSIVAALLTMAAAMVAYVLPRRAEPVRRQSPRSNPPGTRSNPPPAQPGLAPLPRSDPPPPNQGSGPPPGRPISEPPGPIAVQRTVVLSGNSGSPPNVAPKRSQTSPGGMQAPSDEAIALADTTAAVPQNTNAPPAAPLFGSRPPPGAGSYSVSSSHPPPMGPSTGTTRTSVERLSPLQSARPPAGPAPASSRRSPVPSGGPDAPVIMSRPPALDPEAETWAARFETTPPPAPPDAPPVATEEVPRKRSGRWKTQVMGSMVPLEVSAAREERPPPSEVPDSFQPQAGSIPEIVPAQPRAPAPAQQAAPAAPAALANTPEPMVHHDAPGWRPQLDPEALGVTPLRDAVLKQVSARRLSIAVTGAPGDARSQVAAALAYSLALSGARVLVVEADFDRPALHQALAVNAPPGAGFSQQLRGHRNDGQAKPWTVLRCVPNLHALVEGRMRSPGLLTSGLLEGAIQELRGHHHVVIMHAPPLNKPSELRPLGTLAQAVVVANPGQPPSVQFGDGALDALL
jgi:Mrp family chromosome partitioning ATPase